MGNVTQAALDSGGDRGGKPSADDVLNSVSAVLQELGNVSKIAAQIEAAAVGAVNAINGAKETAKGEIEGQKIAAIRAVEAAKPKSSWLDELDRPPGWKPGDPR